MNETRQRAVSVLGGAAAGSPFLAVAHFSGPEYGDPLLIAGLGIAAGTAVVLRTLLRSTSFWNTEGMLRV
jgi:hypothetical protein